jgi:hypothetical protein
VADVPTLPDADMLILDIVRTAIPAGVEFGTQIPADLIESLPFCKLNRIGGSSVDPRFLDRASIDVQVWADDRTTAYATTRAVGDALRDAALDQTTFDDGHVAHFVEETGPSELRTADQAADVWRFQASYSLFLRPAPA